MTHKGANRDQRLRTQKEGFVPRSERSNANREGVTEPELSPRVFVVDDEPIIASTLATILKKRGFDARYFVNPVEALEASRTNDLEILISDVIMPKLSGVDLAIKVKEIRPHCKVLLLSEQAGMVDLLKKARRDGHNFPLLTKPVHPPTLLAQIRAMKPDNSAVEEHSRSTSSLSVSESPMRREITDADLDRFRRANGVWI
jgi:DNA-binding NtrC family response regulator